MQYFEDENWNHGMKNKGGEGQGDLVPYSKREN